MVLFVVNEWQNHNFPLENPFINIMYNIQILNIITQARHIKINKISKGFEQQVASLRLQTPFKNQVIREKMREKREKERKQEREKVREKAREKMREKERERERERN